MACRRGAALVRQVHDLKHCGRASLRPLPRRSAHSCSISACFMADGPGGSKAGCAWGAVSKELRQQPGSAQAIASGETPPGGGGGGAERRSMPYGS